MDVILKMNTEWQRPKRLFCTRDGLDSAMITCHTRVPEVTLQLEKVV